MKRDIYSLITRAQSAYALCLDEGRLEEWPDFFHREQCFYKVTTARNHRQNLEAGMMWADSHGMLVDRISSLREANIYEPHSYRHILGQPHVQSETADDVRCETSFLVIRVTSDGPTDIFATGRYLDRYSVAADKALLLERIVVCDSSRIDTLLAIPL
jgi:anthranilate 1,2-dioxygenase small subunit